MTCLHLLYFLSSLSFFFLSSKFFFCSFKKYKSEIFPDFTYGGGKFIEVVQVASNLSSDGRAGF